jgi:DNA recombination protein RmuC
MPLWIVGIIAAIAGILIGFWLRSGSAKERGTELTRDLTAAKSELAQSQAESTARAGFEALALERGKTVDRLHQELQIKADSERMLSARVKELEAELRNERQSLAEKLALLETAKKALSDQFQALAAEILN